MKDTLSTLPILIELREAIVEKLAKDNNIKTDAENVIVTCGASESLYAAAQALFEKGDNVLVPNPGFLSYYTCVQLAEANVVEVTTPMENEFKMKVEDVQERIDKNTKGLIINSPSNPTGAVMDKEDIKGIADLATDHDFINGFSKTYAMTGLRVGYMVANDDVTENLLKVHQYCTANAPSVSQVGAIEALTGPQDSVKKMVAEFSRRRDLIVSSLNDMGYETVDCKGAFYVFPKVDRPMEFVKAAAEAGVISVPGSPFGSLGQEHVRMSYANSYENIEKAMDILKDLDY